MVFFPLFFFFVTFSNRQITTLLSLCSNGLYQRIDSNWIFCYKKKSVSLLPFLKKYQTHALETIERKFDYSTSIGVEGSDLKRMTAFHALLSEKYEVGEMFGFCFAIEHANMVHNFKVISSESLDEFCKKYPELEGQLRLHHHVTDVTTYEDIRQQRVASLKRYLTKCDELVEIGLLEPFR